MRKMWVKKDNIYKKPFYKQKLRLTFCGVCFVSFVYIFYQVFYMTQLQRDSNRETAPQNPSQQPQEFQGWHPNKDVQKTIVRGIRSVDAHFYLPSERGTFRCISSNQEISFAKVNDDYCDCESDGSDEPSTNACSRGIFYCETPQIHLSGKTYNHVIPSSRINDGICDCCDGSDEWMQTRRRTPCPVTCV